MRQYLRDHGALYTRHASRDLVNPLDDAGWLT